MNQAPPTLLYIDDDAALARLVERGLARLGFKVIHAASGEEGLKRLRGGGIPYVKWNRSVRYRLVDIEAWEQAHLRHSTSDVGGENG